MLLHPGPSVALASLRSWLISSRPCRCFRAHPRRLAGARSSTGSPVQPRRGRTITAAIPPTYARYATVVVPYGHTAKTLADAARVEVLQAHTPAQSWWLGYLDTGVADLVAADATKVAVYVGWPYVLLEGGSTLSTHGVTSTSSRGTALCRNWCSRATAPGSSPRCRMRTGEASADRPPGRRAAPAPETPGPPSASTRTQCPPAMQAGEASSAGPSQWAIVNRPVLLASGCRPEVRGQRADGVAIVGAVTALLSHAFFDRRDARAMSTFSNAEGATSA